MCFESGALCGSVCSWDLCVVCAYESSPSRVCCPWQAAAAGAIALGHDCWGSALFCLALNHKQMSMYLAPAFFAHLLGKCLQQPTLSQKVSALDPSPIWSHGSCIATSGAQSVFCKLAGCLAMILTACTR